MRSFTHRLHWLVQYEKKHPLGNSYAPPIPRWMAVYKPLLAFSAYNCPALHQIAIRGGHKPNYELEFVMIWSWFVVCEPWFVPSSWGSCGSLGGACQPDMLLLEASFRMKLSRRQDLTVWAMVPWWHSMNEPRRHLSAFCAATGWHEWAQGAFKHLLNSLVGCMTLVGLAKAVLSGHASCKRLLHTVQHHKPHEPWTSSVDWNYWGGS